MYGFMGKEVHMMRGDLWDILRVAIVNSAWGNGL